MQKLDTLPPECVQKKTDLFTTASRNNAERASGWFKQKHLLASQDFRQNAKDGILVADKVGKISQELAMLSKDELQRIHEEREVLEKWRKVSRHVVADLLEACSVCGTVREREHLTRCPWCEDVYLCHKGCMYTHNSHLHPRASFWL